MGISLLVWGPVGGGLGMAYNLKSQQNKQNESDLFNNFQEGHGKHSHPTCRLVPIKVCTSLVRSTSGGSPTYGQWDDPPSRGVVPPRPPPPEYFCKRTPNRNIEKNFR